MTTPQKQPAQLSPENYIRQKGRNLALYECQINDGWQSDGMAQIVIARQHTNGNITACIYMVDLFCLGIRDSLFAFNMEVEEYEDLMEEMNNSLEMTLIDYPLAHNIILTGEEYGEELGFKPHKDFSSITQFFLEEDTDEIPLIDIECGVEGKPVFIKSDSFSPAQINGIIKQLERAVGINNFTVMSEEDLIEE